jgi:two-component system sensor kinase FixL
MNSSTPIDILVIEDEADARENLRDILELDEHRVATAGSAAEALARDDWGRFAVVILDRGLPDATAETLLPRLKALAPAASVIIVTGYSDIQGAIAALRQGATDYILKPINADALRASMERVAERQRLAQAKERSDAAFRHLVEAAECLIVIVRLDHAIIYFSPFAERLTGYAATEVKGRDYLALLIPEGERQIAADELARVLAGQPSQGFEHAVVCRDGGFRSVAWNARYLPDYEGAPAILEVGQDITFIKEAQERALQAERLAAIGQMVTGLAHESRNALQRSQACLEMLALADRDRPEALDLIGRLQKAQDDLHHLYEDVRTYAAPIVLDKGPCDLRAVWRNAWLHLEPARTGKEAALQEEGDGVDLHCVADAFRLEQVFRNILENSLAACRPPIMITVRAEPAVARGKPWVRIAVRDNGPGIGPEQRVRVFDPFYTTKARGTGLGMAIARRIIEAHGGTISIGENDQPGAIFFIALPRGTP